MSKHHPRARTGQDRSSLYDEITSEIIAELEAGYVPWVLPWETAAAGVSLAMPRNAATNRQYSGVNVLILWITARKRGFSGQSWLTYRQALALGGYVRKGECGTTVVYADRFVPLEEKRRAYETGEEAQAVPFLKRFTIFNTDQCDALPTEIATAAPPLRPGIIEPTVEALIKATGIDFRIGGSRAFYAPAEDYVQVPPPAAYFEPINWHRTALHELGHNAAIQIMPHGLRWRPDSPALAMRLFGIIRALPGTRGVDRQAGTGPAAWLGRRRARAPFPSSACRHGCRSGWSRRSRDQARARSPLDRRRGGAGPSPCCGAAYVA
ncbi:ArdC family protein [Bradyrhizobium genosp. P]|uniref:ArdC family protein n=1 Tax=Bradyrhizobium genosp. P TaxID=83641 RepID=UPI003CE726B4